MLLPFIYSAGIDYVNEVSDSDIMFFSFGLHAVDLHVIEV